MWFTAEPAVSGPPQSSTIFISIALGQAAGTLKSVPSEVNKSTNLAGVQPAAACALDAAGAEAPGSTSATSTVRSEPSPKRRVTAPWWTPGPRPARFGCIAIREDLKAGTEPFGGVIAIQFPPSPDDWLEVYVALAADTLVNVSDCGSGLGPPGIPMKSTPLG